MFAFVLRMGLSLSSLVLVACSSGPASRSFSPNDTQIFRSGETRALTFAQLVSDLARADIVLVGERHDQARHHQAQLALLQALQAQRPWAGVALEMVPTTAQASFSEAQQALYGQPLPAAARLSAAVKWPPEWDWQAYYGIVSWLLGQQIPMVGANLDRTEIQTIMRGAQPLHGRVSTAESVKTQLADLMTGDHAMPAERLDAMVQAQLFKDRRMAQTLVQSRKPVALLAGNVHVSKQMGIPLHLQDLGSRRYVSIILLPSGQDRPDGHADYFWVID